MRMGTDGDPVRPIEVLQRWFSAHERRNLAAASALMAPGAGVRALDQELVGFDEFMQWYADRRKAHGPLFSYEVEELLDGQGHAVALIRLTDDDHTWRQVAVLQDRARHDRPDHRLRGRISQMRSEPAPLPI